jgi:hypothetical protein
MLFATEWILRETDISRQDGCSIVSTKQTLDYMTDTQIVHIYRLDRESIYELYHELEAELARPTLFQFHYKLW